MNLRLYGALAALALLIILGWWIHHAGYESGQRAAHSQMQADVDAANARTAKVEQDSSTRAEKNEREHQAQIAKRDADYRDAERRIGPVRVCAPASHRELPEATSAATVDPGAPSGDQLPRPAGEDPRDIGPDLVQLVKDADQQADRLVACQRYAEGIVEFRGSP